MSLSGFVEEILLSKEKGGAMLSVDRVEALAGQGLSGDHNSSREVGANPNKNLTLIELEKIEEFSRAYGLDFTGQDARRNIVTRGIALNPLLGQEFFIGKVKVKALELCEPCNLLAKRTHRQVLHGLVHKGGLRCQIITGGAINRGDTIRASE